MICYRRRRNNSRELTFDALEGMGGASLGSKRRVSEGYLTSPSPAMSGGAIGLNSVTSGGYDDGYEYEMQSNAGYPVQQGYGNGGFDDYSASQPHPGYHPSPTIFQEDYPLPMAATYATASSMSRDRLGFDQNLPEVMYNGAGAEDPAATGYYDVDAMYSDGGRSQDPHQAGLWVANPESQNAQHDSPYATDAIVPQDMTPQLNLSLDAAFAGSSPKMSRNSGNPQGLPDSPILRPGTLRGGDVFGEDGEARATSSQPTSPRPTPPPRVTSPTSPRMMRASPVPRSSGEIVHSYANEYAGRPSGEGSKSPMSQNKSLRTLRRDDWS
ncbi:hypothetical protein EDD21DRAFT_366971 [Dissophora ornata]|nr:hypothetical protein EDD21DRAFT_366971 [Dissophora ornata]